MSQQVEKFTFKYNGDLEYIDFDTLLTSQVHFTEAIRELKETLYPEGELKIKVKALPPSSFPIELYLDISQNPEKILLYGSAAIIAVGGFAGAINSIIDLYKHLSNRSPDKETKKGDVTYIQVNNTTLEINTTLYDAVKANPRIRKELSATFEKIKKDDEVTGIDLVYSNGKKMNSLSKSDFDSFSSEAVERIIEESEVHIRKLLKKDARLKIFKVVFERGFKWQFVYVGHRISANIIDENFLIEVGKGERSFTNGDTMICDLRIDQKFNPFVNAFENLSYTIAKVIDYIPRSQQSQFDFDDETEG